MVRWALQSFDVCEPGKVGAARRDGIACDVARVGAVDSKLI
jgi:hypothetical protein